MSIQLRDGLANRPLDHVLEDMLVRFLVNCPNEDLSSIERVLFQVEEAQWFYTDFVRQQYPGLPSMKMKAFSGKMLEKCPLIWKWGNASDALSKFGKYKSSIPVRGIALFNSDLSKVLFVKGYDSNTWSFPRGKISKDESDINCAIREVEEETGFNAKDLIDENNLIERTIKGKNYKIYLVKDVPEDFPFKPHARNEIASIEWHDVKSLSKKIKYNPNVYFIVPAIIKPLMKWITENKGTINETELMLQAEIKLKNILGINEELQASDNNDAGRELLDLLQGVQPSEDSGNNSDPVSIPQPMSTPYEYLSQPSAISYQGQPIIPGQQSQSFPQTTNLDASIANTPNPESLKKPTSLMNSKEILSVLQSGSKPQPTPAEEAKRTEDVIKNKAKAEKLLNLFKRDHSTPSPTSFSKESSNEVEKSYVDNQNEGPTPGKVSLLKRDTNGTNVSERGNELLSLLGQKPSPSTEKSQNSSPSNDLLSLLNKKDTNSETASPSLTNKDTVDKQEKPSNPANELLGLLGKPTEKSTEDKQESGKESDIPDQNNGDINVLASQDLQSVLNKGSTPAQDNEEDFEDFEDFEDYNNQNGYGNSVNQRDHGFDIDSDDGEEEFFEPEPQSQEPISESISEPISEPMPEPMPEQQPASDSRNRSASPDNQGPKKGTFKLLRPGESLKGAINEADDSKSDTKSLGHGNDLLKLLQSKPNPESNHSSPVLNPLNNSYNSIYGNPESTEEHSPVPSRTPQPQPQPQSKSSGLLSLLTGRGSSNEKPSQSTQETPKPKSSASSDLLGMLKRPSNDS